MRDVVRSCRNQRVSTAIQFRRQWLGFPGYKCREAQRAMKFHKTFQDNVLVMCAKELTWAHRFRCRLQSASFAQPLQAAQVVWARGAEEMQVMSGASQWHKKINKNQPLSEGYQNQQLSPRPLSPHDKFLGLLPMPMDLFKCAQRYYTVIQAQPVIITWAGRGWYKRYAYSPLRPELSRLGLIL